MNRADPYITLASIILRAPNGSPQDRSRCAGIAMRMAGVVRDRRHDLTWVYVLALAQHAMTPVNVHGGVTLDMILETCRRNGRYVTRPPGIGKGPALVLTEATIECTIIVPRFDRLDLVLTGWEQHRKRIVSSAQLLAKGPRTSMAVARLGQLLTHDEHP